MPICNHPSVRCHVDTKQTSFFLISWISGYAAYCYCPACGLKGPVVENNDPKNAQLACELAWQRLTCSEQLVDSTESPTKPEIRLQEHFIECKSFEEVIKLLTNSRCLHPTGDGLCGYLGSTMGPAHTVSREKALQLLNEFFDQKRTQFNRGEL